MQKTIILVLGALAICLAGCRSIGPKTVPRDRFDYSTSLTESWKRQTLLNIVKLRYLDPPAFVDIGNIVAGYSLETAASVGGQVSSAGALQGNNLLLGGSGRFVDRPTITYVPMTGNRFMEGLMTPISSRSLFSSIQSGWPADAMLSVGVTTMNGLNNEEITLGGYTPADPKFLRAVELIREIQRSGAVGMRVLQSTNKQETELLTFRSAGISPETLQQIDEFRGLLGLDPDAYEFKLVHGATAMGNQEIALLTRSVIHMIQAMAMRAEMPQAHIQEGRAVPGILDNEQVKGDDQQVLIRCTKSKPKDAFVTVEYRDHWFWVDDRDLRAKRSFTFTMLLFALADPGEVHNLPVVTIPAQ